jgi:hypothetical protein
MASYLKVTKGPVISYTWSSIVRGINALKSGLIWRVGNGEKIRIWEDPWIPLGTTRHLITPRSGVLITRVCELIDPAIETWDVQLVRDIFLGGGCNQYIGKPSESWA